MSKKRLYVSLSSSLDFVAVTKMFPNFRYNVLISSQVQGPNTELLSCRHINPKQSCTQNLLGTLATVEE
jgi:hypothetical protein